MLLLAAAQMLALPQRVSLVDWGELGAGLGTAGGGGNGVVVVGMWWA